jgi:hypothetical protein
VWDHTASSPEIAFSPQAGAMLIHVHGDDCLVHEVDPVTSGIKYVLRTELIIPSDHLEVQETSASSSVSKFQDL